MMTKQNFFKLPVQDYEYYSEYYENTEDQEGRISKPGTYKGLALFALEGTNPFILLNKILLY